MLKLGIAGLGFIGRMHLASVRASGRAEVVAVADRVPANLSGASAGGGNLVVQGDTGLEGVAKYDDASALLADPHVEAVLLALPTYLHKRYILEAIERRKHILVEKPLALTPEEGREVVDALQGYDKVFMVAHCIRFWPAYAKAAEIIRSGDYGRVLTAAFTRNSPKPTWSWQGWLMHDDLSGGALLDLHIHDVDYVNGLFGRPASVKAAGVREGREGIGQVTALYTYPDGTTVSLDGGWCYHPTFPFRMVFRVACEKATLEFDSRTGPELHIYTAAGEHLLPDLQPGDGYSAEFNYFTDCIDKGIAPTVVTPRSSLESLELVAWERQALEAACPSV